MVSIVIPCRNEESYIKNCLMSLINQSLSPEKYEILVVDGMSDDGTVSLIENIQKKYSLVRLLKNEKKITPVARNLGIAAAKGEIIAICDAHAVYDSLYLENALEIFQRQKDADCVGGPIISAGETHFGKATALAMSSKIGVGNAKHRFPDYEGYAEMACFPIYKKEVFDKIGLFDESMVRNQDDEFSQRFRLSGGKVYITPKIKSTYFVRNSAGKLYKQYFGYGFYRWKVLHKNKVQISYRQMIPPMFVMVLLLWMTIGIFLKSFILAAFLPLFYIFTISAVGIIKVKKNSSLLFYFVVSVMTLHISYGLGVIYSFLKDKLFRN